MGGGGDVASAHQQKPGVGTPLRDGWGPLSLLAAGALLGHPGAVPTVRQLCAPVSYRHCHLAAPSKVTRGQWGEDCSLQGPCSCWDFCSQHASRLTSLQGTGGQQDQGEKYPTGRFALPGRTGIEGHSCCGCHRALISSREEMGAARAPTSHRGGCVWSQPMASPRPLPAPWVLPDPCPHTARQGRSPAHTPAASWKEKQPEIS